MQSLLSAGRPSVNSLSLGQVHMLSLLAFCAAGLALVAPPLLLPASPPHVTAGSGGWPVRFCTNLAGYASVLLPLYLGVRLARGWDYAARGPAARESAACGGLLPACIRLLALGSEGHQRGDNGQNGQQLQQQKDTATRPYSTRWCLHLASCCLGLQAAYLTWGLLQERMMTFDYHEGDSGKGERFRDSQFLVFANRALGGLLALPMMLLALPRSPASTSDGRQQRTAPAFEYVYSSLSNILSSWCQYEALVYVTFPTQVLAKASKIIPVMLMGHLVSRKSYRLDEYFTSGLISAGTAMFLLSSSTTDSASSANASSPATVQTAAVAGINGALLLTGYLVFDAFTSSWQSRLFVEYRVTSLQMMAGSSLLSCLVTVAAQLQQGSLSAALAFTGRHPLFAIHLAMLSLCSTFGQLVIFHTIDCFGPVTFIIIMTVRQAFAILISCMVYQHQLSGNAWLGVCAVFAALFLRIYFGHRAQRRQRH